MKKILYLVLITLFSFITKVSAASLCSYEEQTKLNQAAANIKVSYEILEETVHFVDMDSTRDYFEISLFNISEDLYVIVKNDINNDEIVLTNKDGQNGLIKFRWDNINLITNFTIQIYSTNNTSCPDERYKTIYLTTPRFNEYYDRQICTELKDFYLCQEYVTFSEIKEADFFKQIDSYKSEKIDDSGNEIVDDTPSTITDKIYNYVNKYKWYSIGILGVILLGLIIIMRKKAKNSKEF